MIKKNKFISMLTAATLLCTSIAATSTSVTLVASATDSIESSMAWDTLSIAGGGFVSGIITGDDQMYARTDVGGAYRYDYDNSQWVQLLDFLSDADRGFLSVDAMCIDPNNDDTLYLLCGCAYFSGARTAIFRSYDAGETFEEIDVTDLIQVHGNGYGRQCGEAIAVDPDNPDILYCGGDVASGSSALIWSQDGGDTWSPVEGYDDLGFYQYTVNWPYWDTHPVRAATTNSEQDYNQQNGVATISITGGKVYVGTSIKGEANVHVADVGSDDFTVLSEDLPTGYYPSRINLDANGKLLISYIAGLMFDGSGGGAYRYDPATKAVTDISPTANSFSAVFSDPDDANKLIATTCGVWYSQSWSEDAWDRDAIAWGDRFFKSTDGGATWTEMTPGNAVSWGGPLEAEYLEDGGHSWIRDKAIHWAGTIVLDPRNSDKLWVTSGNGVFTSDNTWDSCPQLYFAADGIEEVVALDLVSVPDGNVYSAIGDYDGFEHSSDNVATQYTPSMSKLTDGSASTGAIAYCSSNPDIMVRCAENAGRGYYSKDGGKTWTELSGVISGAKAAINQLEDGSYRIFLTAANKITYTDDFGATWTDVNNSQNLSKTWITVDAENPQYVYAYGYYYNQYYFYSKPTATIEDARYVLMVSDDYGATFSSAQTICQYDECDAAYRIGYLGEGTFAIAAGYYGAYLVTDYGKTVTKMDNVSYCKTMGYGAPENEGDPNTLYIWGKPAADDAEGVYRSTDCGKTWVAINLDHTYGGTGNGNFLVGDMNTFGTVYMSTVGCGIVRGQLTGENPPVVTTESTAKTTTSGTTSTTTVTTAKSTAITSEISTDSTNKATDTTLGTTPDSSVLYGDIDLDGKVALNDAVLLNKAIAGAVSLNEQAILNSDCDANDETGSNDAIVLLKFLVHLIESLPYTG